MKKNEFYSLNSLLGHASQKEKIYFYTILGARGYGKTFAVQRFLVKKFLKKKIPFYWIRLNEGATKKLLANNAEKLIDQKLVRKYKLNLQTKGNQVYNVKFNDEGKLVKQELMCTVLALSTFYSDKGTARFDGDFLNNPDMYYHIVLDEFQKEKTEKSQGDVAYQFVNQMENLIRDSHERIKIFLIGNTLEEASDILATCFNFIPEKFGRYVLKKKKCIIDYVESSKEYKQRREKSVANLLTPQASTFTNKIEMDKSLVFKGRLKTPNTIIKFSKDINSWFVIWDDNIICKYNKEKINTIVAMRPYIDQSFFPVYRDVIIDNFDRRNYRFKNLITMKLFQRELQLLKPRK